MEKFIQFYKYMYIFMTFHLKSMKQKPEKI